MKELGNIEYHKGWIEEKNKEPEKLHRKFSVAEKNGLIIGGISPSEIGESTEDDNMRIREMEAWEYEDQEMNSMLVRNIFKDQIFHNREVYPDHVVKAMEYVVSHVRESVEEDNDREIGKLLEKICSNISHIRYIKDKLNENIYGAKETANLIAKEANEAAASSNKIIERLGDRLGKPNEERLMNAICNYFELFGKDDTTTFNGDISIEDWKKLRTNLWNTLQVILDTIKSKIVAQNKRGKTIYSVTGTEITPKDLKLDVYYKDFCREHKFDGNRLYFHGRQTPTKTTKVAKAQ